VSERQREMAVGFDHQPVEAVDHVEAAREVADSRAEPGQDRAGDIPGLGAVGGVIDDRAAARVGVVEAPDRGAGWVRASSRSWTDR